MHTPSKKGRTCASIFFSFGVNALILAMLAGLNSMHSARPDRMRGPEPSITVIRDRQPEPEPRAPDNPPPEPEIMTVDLDRLSPRSVALKPVQVDVIVPDLSQYAASSTGDSAARTYAVDDVDEPPGDLAIVRPHYPRTARMQGVEGMVVVKILIDEEGSVRDIRVLEVEGHAAFRESVLGVARNWKFTPARHDGHAVAVWAIKRVRFRLED